MLILIIATALLMEGRGAWIVVFGLIREQKAEARRIAFRIRDLDETRNA